MTLSHSVTTPEAERARAAAPRTRGAATTRRLPVSALTWQWRPPRTASIFATEPLSGSKNSSLTFASRRGRDREQPAGRRELDALRLQTASLTGPVAPRRRTAPAPAATARSRRTPWPGRDARTSRDRDRVLDQDRLVGDDVVDVLALLLRGDRLVLVGDEDVAVARGEVLQRLAARLVLDRDVLGDQLAQVVRPARGSSPPPLLAP